MEIHTQITLTEPIHESMPGSPPIQVQQPLQTPPQLRLKFRRGKEVMFLSHLDLMRTFSRAFRRTDIPIGYSKGFNPHMEMIFGLPLQVGVTSDSEYLDITLLQKMEPLTIQEKLNKQLPAGIEIISARLKETKSNIMSAVSHASYKMVVCYNNNSSVIDRDIDPDSHLVDSAVLIDNLKIAVQEFLALSEVIVTKETKHAKKDVNIRPLIVSLTVNEDTLLMTVCAGSAENLKPDLLLEALNNINLDKKLPLLSKAALHRTNLFIKQEECLLKPDDDRVLKSAPV